jgi:hypothetical protein
VYPGAVYLYPAGDGRWNVLDIDADPAETYADLESACHGVVAYIERREHALRRDR